LVTADRKNLPEFSSLLQSPVRLIARGRGPRHPGRGRGRGARSPAAVRRGGRRPVAGLPGTGGGRRLPPSTRCGLRL